MLRTIVLVILILSGLVYGICAFATIDRRNDEKQIRSLIENASASIQNRNLSGTIRCVSYEYKDDEGINYDRLRVFVVQALRTEIKYTITTNIKSININDKDATVDLHVLIKPASDSESLYNRDITLDFHKERGRHAMLIPVDVWRIRNAKNLGVANFDL